MIVVARSGAWLGFLLLALAALHGLEVGDSFGGWSDLAGGPDAAAGMVIALTRLVALGLGWYLVAATALTLLADVTGSARRLSRVAHGFVPRSIDQLLRGVCGLALALGTATSPAPAAAGEPAPIEMRRLPNDDTAPTTGGEPITMRRLAPESAPPGDDPVMPPTSTSGTHVIAPGEHLWSIAETTLARTWETPPTDAEVDPFWRELIRRNRARLADPGNRDLVHPGAVLEVPPVPFRDV